MPRLGADGAYAFALAALTDVMHHLAVLPVHKTLFYTPATASSDIASFLARESLQSPWDICPQVPGDGAMSSSLDLGARLSAVLERIQTLVLGSTRPNSSESTAPLLASPVAVTFIGMDCFDLTPSTILDSMSLVSATTTAAAAAAAAHMLPARDGGYVLLTVPLTCASSVFHRIPWSENQTARVQIDRLEEAGLSCVVGDVLDDVDDPQDLERLWEARGQKKFDAYPRTMKYLEAVMIR